MNDTQLDIRFEETGKTGVAIHRTFKSFAEKQLIRWLEKVNQGSQLTQPHFYVSFRKNPHTGRLDCRVNARVSGQSFFGCGFGQGSQQALHEAIAHLQIISRLRRLLPALSLPPQIRRAV